MRSNVLSLALLCLAAACSDIGHNPVISDPAFQLWRSDTELAAWQVPVGSIRKVGTWHPADPGVEFVSTPTELSQNVKASGCVRITVMGLVEPGADLVMSSGGTSVEIPALDWQSHSDFLRIVRNQSAPAVTPDAGGVWIYPDAGPARLSFVKRGPGRVVLASVWEEASTGCDQ